MKAKKEQRCLVCGGQIYKGNDIDHVENYWVHRQCGVQLSEAKAAMARERDKIEATPRGTPGLAANAWRRRQKRRDG